MSLPQAEHKTNPLSRNQTKAYRGEPQIVYRQVPAVVIPDPIYIFRNKKHNGVVTMSRPDGCRGEALVCFSTEEKAREYGMTSEGKRAAHECRIEAQPQTGIYARLPFFFLDGRLVQRERVEEGGGS